MIGADGDPVVFENTAVDRLILVDDGRMDLAPASIDLACSDYVLEHVERPQEFLAEGLPRPKAGGKLLVPDLKSPLVFKLHQKGQ